MESKNLSKEHQVPGFWCLPWCPQEIWQAPLYCLQWSRQQFHRVLTVQAVALTQIMSVSCITARIGSSTLNGCGGHFLIVGWHAVLLWGHRLRKVQETLACPHTRHLSPKVHGKLYTTSIYLAVLHSSETWGPNASDLQWLCLNDRTMICWICGTKGWDKTPGNHYSRNLALRIISNLSQTWSCAAPKGEEGLERRGRNVWRMMPDNVACLVLTRKIKRHLEPVFDVAWCCHTYRMGPGQHPNFKMHMMMTIMTRLWWSIK